MNKQATSQKGKPQELWEKIKDNPYCDPMKRMDFVLVFDVRDGNPNGDPDAGNLPRMDPQTRQGIVTDVCIKRKVRDYLTAVLDRSIYIQSQAALNTLYFRAARGIADSKPNENTPEAADKSAVHALLVELDEQTSEFKTLIAVSEEIEKEEAAENKPIAAPGDQEQRPPFCDWLKSIEVEGLDFDPDWKRLSYLGESKSAKDFASLLTQEEFKHEPYRDEITTLAKLLAKAKKDKKGGAQERQARDAVKREMCKLYDDIRLFGGVLTAGTNAGQIRGPLQLTFARSVEPILQQDAAITRCAITKSSDWAKKQTEFGRKPWLSWAVYRQHGFFNPLLGQQTFVTREDLARFWESLAFMFRNSDSASKGEMTMHDIIVFVHDHPRGNAASHQLFDCVTVKPSRGDGAETSELSAKTEDMPTVCIHREGFEHRYLCRVTKANADLKPHGIQVYHPLSDLRPNL